MATIAALAALLALGPPVSAAAPRKQQAIVLDAQSADATMDNVVFKKVKITQGEMSIAADQGQGTRRTNNVDFNDSAWNFRGNVRINVDDGQVNADAAMIKFLHQQLSSAVATGNPATFEQHMAKTGKIVRGHADNIDYDAARGLVSLLTNAWLSDGQSEFRGPTVTYNIISQSIVAESSDQGSQRVHIVVPPPPSKP